MNIVDELKGKELIKKTFFEKKENFNVFIFSGDLGTGKTTFISSLISEITGERYVNSPTYTIVNTYNWNEKEIFHVDLYRLEEVDELFELAIFEEQGEDVIYFVEWPDKFMDFFNRINHIMIKIEKAKDNEKRNVYINEHTLH